ncbi:hypothetical protein TCEA9_14020 [Thermobrachium celere]|nr:hypothetical protein TCEA9_14020 [Thermobrachium celere]
MCKVPENIEIIVISPINTLIGIPSKNILIWGTDLAISPNVKSVMNKINTIGAANFMPI